MSRNTQLEEAKARLAAIGASAQHGLRARGLRRYKAPLRVTLHDLDDLRVREFVYPQLGRLSEDAQR